MRRDESEDDERVIADGKSLRVRMTAMDTAMRDAIARGYPAMHTEAYHKPGFRGLGAVHDTALKRQAYRDYELRICDEYKSPTGGGGYNNPVTGFGSSGPRGSREGDPCTKDGCRGVLRRRPDSVLYCDIGKRDADPNFPRKKIKRNRFNQEEGEEQYEHDGLGNGACPHCNGTGIASGHKQSGWLTELKEEYDGDEDDFEEMLGRMTTNTESAARRDVSDHKTLDQIRKAHAERMAREYALADSRLMEAWRNS